MDETKVQIGNDVLLDIGVHSDWYISTVGYNGESVDVVLRRKADKMEYLNELKELIDGFFKQTERSE